jgi:hypothetical protein
MYETLHTAQSTRCHEYSTAAITGTMCLQYTSNSLLLTHQLCAHSTALSTVTSRADSDSCSSSSAVNFTKSSSSFYSSSIVAREAAATISEAFVNSNYCITKLQSPATKFTHTNSRMLMLR